MCETKGHRVPRTAELLVTASGDGQLFRLIPHGRVKGKAFTESLWSSSSISLALLSSPRSLALFAKHAVGKRCSDRSGEIECIIKRNECQCITIALHIRCQLRWQAEFPRFSPLFSSSYSSSFSFSLSLGLPDTWRQLRDVTSKSSVPWASENECRNFPPRLLPSLDFPPSSHYWWSARHREYKRAETGTSHL